MGMTRKTRPAKLILGMISQDIRFFDIAKDKTERRFGTIDCESEIFAFDQTGYYEKEMGTCLKRKFLSFKKLINADRIAKIKSFTNKLEKITRGSKLSGRKINLDPGYITDAKLVLATTKDYYHRIYLGKGIFGEVTLCFKEGSFRDFPWTYPDYRKLGYINFFNEVRKIYLEQIRLNK